MWPKGGITQELINEAKGKPNYEKLLHCHFANNPIEFKAKQGVVFDAGGMFDSTPIPEPSTAWLTPDVIQKMDVQYVYFWHTYFQNETEKWRNLSKEQVTAFVSRFSNNQKLAVLPLDDVEIVREQLYLLPYTKYLQAGHITWLFAIHEKLGDFLPEPIRIMLIRDSSKV